MSRATPPRQSAAARLNRPVSSHQSGFAAGHAPTVGATPLCGIGVKGARCVDVDAAMIAASAQAAPIDAVLDADRALAAAAKEKEPRGSSTRGAGAIISGRVSAR
jgi:hypothetical protein